MGMREKAPGDRGKGAWLLTLTLGLLSLAPRVYAALAWAREPVWDGHYYDFGARRIAEGLGYSDDIIIDGAAVWHPWCHYPVGYSGFLAGIYSIFGSGNHVAPIANAVLGAILVMLTHRIGLFWLTPARAVVAAVLCAFNLELILYTPLVMTEILATTGPMLAIFLVLTQRAHHPLRGAGLGGAVVGLSTLVQPQTILFAPFLGFWATGKKSLRARMMTALLASSMALVVVAPWTYRNCKVMDGCAFVSTNGGWNLAIGAFPRATGRFETLRASDGCTVVTGQVQQDQCWGALGLEMIRKDVGRWLGLAPAKLGHCFDHASFPVEYLGQADPMTWSDETRAHGRKLLMVLHHLLMSIAAFGFIGWEMRDWKKMGIETILRALMAGLVALGWFSDAPIFWPLAIGIACTGLLPRSSSPTQGPTAWLITVSFLLFLLTHMIFFGEDRYHVRLIPMMCLLAAAVFRPSHRPQ